MNELEELLGVPPMQLPILRQLHTLNQRLWTFVTCFVQGRRINTLYECFQAFLLQEGIREFHELRMGNSFLHTEAVQSLYHGPTAMLNVSTRDILNHLRQFENMIGHDAFRNSTHIDRSEFLQYLSQQYRQPNIETLGIAIDPAGFGVYIGLLRRLSNQEMKEMKNIEQEFQKGIAEKVFELTKEKFSAENRKLALDELLKTHLGSRISQEQDQQLPSSGGNQQQWQTKRNANKSSTASLSLEMLKRVTDIDVYLDNVLRRKAANEQRNNQKQISSQEIAETDLKIRNQLTRFLMATQKSKHHSRIKVVTWVLCGVMAKIHSLLLHDDKLPDEKTASEGDDDDDSEATTKKKTGVKGDDADSEDECDCCCVGKDTCKCSCTCDCHANSSDEEEEEEAEEVEKTQASAAKSSTKSVKLAKPVAEASPEEVAAMKREVDAYLVNYCESNDIESLEQLLMCFISLEIHMRQAMQNFDQTALELVLELWNDAADKDEFKTEAWCQAFNRFLSVQSSGAAGDSSTSDREEITKFIQQCYLSTSSRLPTAELTQQVAARVRHEFGFEKLQMIGPESMDTMLDEAREGAEVISPSIVKYSNALLPASGYPIYHQETTSSDSNRSMAASIFLGESLRVQKTEEAIAALLQCPFLVDIAKWTLWQQHFAPFCGSLRFFIRTHEMILVDHASSSSRGSSLMLLFCHNGVVLRVNEASTPSALESLISATTQIPPEAHQVAIHLASMLVKNGGQLNFPAQLVQAHVKSLFAVIRSASGAQEDEDNNKALERYVLEILLAVPTEFGGFVFSLLAEVAESSASARSKFADNMWESCTNDFERRALASIAKGMAPSSVTWADKLERSHDQALDAIETDDLSNPDGPMLQLSTLLSSSQSVSGNKENDLEITDRFARAKEIPIQSSTVPDANSSTELIPVSSTMAPESCRQCIDTIRKEQFGIGLEIQDAATSAVLAIQQQRLERALKRLSDELYSENTHFVLELLQNADDNSYEAGVRAKGEFVLTTSRQVVFHNNERGFSSANIQAICDVGASTKSSVDSSSSIGKKGIGFKSVFKISDSPQVHSNGFHIRFRAKNDDAHGGGLGYILPFWIEDQTKWQRQQGTTFVLPLNQASAARVDEISESLMAFEPSILLFLRRIRELRIADQVHNQTLHFLKEASMRGRHHQTVQLFSQIRRKGSSADRVVVAQQQWLVVKMTLIAPAAFASAPDQVRETEIAVALPFDLSSSSSASGDRPPLQQVFAYLPLRSYGFRFIVQGDFEVPSSREAIVNGSEWNQWLVSQLPGLLRQVVMSFVDELQLTNDKADVVAQVAHLLSLLPFENEIQAPFRSIVLDTLREISQVPFLPAATLSSESLSTSLELVKPAQLLDAWEALQDDDVLSVLTSDASLLFTTLNKKLLHFELSKTLQPQQKNQLKIEKLKASHILQLLVHSSVNNDVKWVVEMLRVLGKLWKKDRHSDLLLQELRLIKCFPIQIQDVKNKKWVSLMDTGDALFLPAVNSGEKSSSSPDEDLNATTESFYGDLHVLDTEFATVLSQFSDARAFLIAQVKVKMIEDHDLIAHHILPKMESLSSPLASASADEALQLKMVTTVKQFSRFLASHLVACPKCPMSAEIQDKMKIWTCTRKLVSASTSNVFVVLPTTVSEMIELSKWLQGKLRQSDKSQSFDLVGREYFEGGDAEATAKLTSAWQKLFVDTLKLPKLFDVSDARVVIAIKQILKWLTTEASVITKESVSSELAGYLNKHWPTTDQDNAASEGHKAIAELLRKTKWLSGTDGKFHRPEKLWVASAASKALFSESMVPYSKVQWTNDVLAVDILRLKKTPTLEDALSVLSSLSSHKVTNELLDISAVSRIYMLLAEQTSANTPAIRQAFNDQQLVFTPADDGRASGFMAVKDVVWSATSFNGSLIPLEQVYPKSLRQFFTEVCGVERKPSINSLCHRLEQLKSHQDAAESDHEAKKHWKKEILPILKFFARQMKKSALSKDELRRIRKTLKTTAWLSVSRSSSPATSGDNRKLTWCSAKDEPVVPRTDEEREVQKIVTGLQKEHGDGGNESVNRIKLVKLDQELLDELDPLLALSKIRSLTSHAVSNPSSWCDLISNSVAMLGSAVESEESKRKTRKKIQKLVKMLLVIWSKAFGRNPELWTKTDKKFQWKLQQSLLLPTLRDQHFLKPADVLINDQTELTRESFAAEDGTSLQPALPILSLFPWTYFTTVDNTSESQGEAAQVRSFLLMFCGAKSLKTQLSYEVIVLGSLQSESARLRSKIQQSLAVAQRLLFHQHRSVYETLAHVEIVRLCREIKCVLVDDAGGLQVVYRVGKSFSVRHAPATCFLDMMTPVLYVIRPTSSSGDDLSGLYVLLMELCRKCFGLQIAASVANLLYLASMQPNAQVLERWLVETQQLAPIDPEEAGTLWFSAEDASGDGEATTTEADEVGPSRKRTRSMLEDGEVKDDDDHHHPAEKRLRQNAEPWTGEGRPGGGGGVFPPLPPSSEGADPKSLYPADAAVYPPLPASSYPGGFGFHHQQMHNPHQPGSFQPPLPPSNATTSNQHTTLHSDQVLSVGNTMTKEEREGIGRWGEAYVYKQLVESHKDNAEMVVDWVNEHEESGKPYDIMVSSAFSGKVVEYVEVKATRTMEKAVFEISMNELDQAAIHGSSYCIYRVFNAGNDALCRVIRMKNPIALVRQKKMQLALIMQ